jgi:uncharacterized membrane protein
MFGLLIAIIVLVLFVVGFIVGALIVIAVRINLEDRAAMKRLDGSVLLHEEPQGPVGRGVRRLLVGQRNGPRQLPGEERRPYE